MIKEGKPRPLGRGVGQTRYVWIPTRLVDVQHFKSLAGIAKEV